MSSHGAVFHLHDSHGDHHEQGQQSVVVVGDSADEQAQTVNTIHETGNSSSPGRDGSDDTDGSGSGIGGPPRADRIGRRRHGTRRIGKYPSDPRRVGSRRIRACRADRELSRSAADNKK